MPPIENISLEEMSDIVVFTRSRRFWGDQIIAFPALYQLKQWWPQDRLIVVGKHPVGAYYKEDAPWVDDYIDAPGFFDKFRAVSPRPRAVVTLCYSGEEYGLIGLCKRAPVRLGFKGNRVSDYTWTHTWPRSRQEYYGLAHLRLLSRLPGA